MWSHQETITGAAPNDPDQKVDAVCCPTLFHTTTADVVAGVVEAGFGFKRHFTVQMVLIVDSFK
jgi:hypothetical protein